MNVDNKVSPFAASHHLWEPYIKGLRLFKALGLPLKITVTEGNKILFEDHLRFLKFGAILGKIRLKFSNQQGCLISLLLVTLILACGIFGALQFTVISIDDMMVEYAKHGFLSTKITY